MAAVSSAKVLGDVMPLAEIEARARGAVELGLNVFAHNTVAVNLSQSLGYEMTSMRMQKRLS